MKTDIAILTFILMSLIGFSQSDLTQEKLSYHSFSVAPIEIFFSSYADGISISADLSFSIYKNIFSLSGTLGEEQLLFGKVDKIKTLNVLFGRRYELEDWLFLETYVGLGQEFNHDFKGSLNKNKIIPLVAKVKVHPLKSISLALKMQTISNSIDKSYSAGILLKWELI